MIKKIYKFIPLVILVIGFLVPLKASAASLFVSTDKTAVRIGDQFNAIININSEGSGINAAQATLTYPKEGLEVTNIDKTGSIFSFWLQEPTYSNDLGQISFTGGSPSGFSGGSLKVLTVSFRVKGSGSSSLAFTDGAVTASDGSGTNVLSSMKGITINITGEKGVTLLVPPPTQISRTAVPSARLPIQPNIEVPLYPIPTDWHSAVQNFLVKWNLPPDVTAVATSIDKNPNAEPLKSEGLFDNKTFPALTNGIWYLHVQFKNNVGWGKPAHYRIAIDNDPPTAFTIQTTESTDTDNPTPLITFKSNDQLSGLDHYTAQIDNSDAVVLMESIYTLPLQQPGKHLVRISAYDKAGNIAEGSIDLNILPIASPQISSLSSTVYVGEGGMTSSGTSLPDIHIAFSLKNIGDQVVVSGRVRSDTDGNWQVQINEPLKKGKYYLEVQAEDSRGAMSFKVKSDVVSAIERPIISFYNIRFSAFGFYASLSVLLLLVIVAGWWLGRKNAIQREMRMLISKRDVASVYNVLSADLDKINKVLGVKKIAEKDISEIKFIVETMDKHLRESRGYVFKGIEEIKK